MSIQDTVMQNLDSAMHFKESVPIKTVAHRLRELSDGLNLLTRIQVQNTTYNVLKAALNCGYVARTGNKQQSRWEKIASLTPDRLNQAMIDDGKRRKRVVANRKRIKTPTPAPTEPVKQDTLSHVEEYLTIATEALNEAANIIDRIRKTLT